MSALGSTVTDGKVTHVRSGAGVHPVVPGTYTEGTNGVTFTSGDSERGGKVFIPNASVTGVHEDKG
jgi:hypothetical protein